MIQRPVHDDLATQLLLTSSFCDHRSAEGSVTSKKRKQASKQASKKEAKSSEEQRHHLEDCWGGNF
jgi:hypothetical protein